MAKQKSPAPAPPEEKQEYTVLARRYRPQKFTELIGQEHIARALENALKSNRVAHAYLFTGARGVGKTSTARILAKALNCEQGPTLTPCDQCVICRSIASGEDVDVLEIDGASNNGVERVREIRNNVQYRPGRSRYKIYIIDEVHMLSTAAFNALLKTLEEPPIHVKFIFATTEVQKIPVTILSRCQRFDFAGIGVAAIKDRLRDIVQRENMQADEEALELVARRAGGSMRDAQSLMDQLLAFGSDRLTADQVHTLLGMAADERVVALASAVLERNPSQALLLLADLVAQGPQLGELVDQLMAYWRDLMVVRCAGDQACDLSLPSRYLDLLKQQANAQSLETVLAGLDILSTTRGRLKQSNQGRLLVEMALVRLARLEELTPISQLVQALTQGRLETTSPSRSARVSSSVVAPPEAVKKKLTGDDRGQDNKSKPLTAESLPTVWADFLATLPPFLSADLQVAELPAIIGPNTLVIRFSSRYNHQKEACQRSEQQKRLEDSLQRLTGQNWTLRFESLAEESVPVPIPVVAPERENTLDRAKRQRDDAEAAPLVKRAMELLGAQIVRVEEGFNTIPEPTPSAPRTSEEIGDGEED